MTFPPSAAAVPSAARRFTWVTRAALGVILLYAAWTRWQWPGIPVADSDTWGYLHPALSRLGGEGFLHTNGRNFVYPLWLYALLASTGSFRAITIAQHALGLGSGVLLWTAWRQWRGWFTDPRLPLWADALLGLGLVAFYEQSASAISYEHHLRPEAIFPFFALIELNLLLAFLRSWYVARRMGPAAALAGAALFVAALLYQLKPSFGLALGVAAAPVLVAALIPWRQPARGRWWLALAVAASALAAALLFVWPEHRLARNDVMSTLFLPETLLTIHADLICDQLAEDVGNHAATPFAPEWLATSRHELQVELRRASGMVGRSYPTLGFNPDYLMYTNSYCSWLNAQWGPPQVAAFGRYYYFRVWAHHPWRMMGKIRRQLDAFYSLHCTTFWPGHTQRVNKLYRRSVDALAYPNYEHALSLFPPARAYVAEARRIGESGLVIPQAPLMVGINTAASVGATPLLWLFGAELLVVVLVRAGLFNAPAVARLLTPGWVLLLFHGFVFGNVLTIAVVHSVDMDRYCLNLLAFYAPALAATLAWLAEFILALCGRSEASNLSS